MAYCRSCGTQLPAEGMFCAKCGAAVAPPIAKMQIAAIVVKIVKNLFIAVAFLVKIWYEITCI